MTIKIKPGKFDLWLKQVEWYLQRRCGLTVQDVGMDVVEDLYRTTDNSLEAVISLIEDMDLTDYVADPWLAPGDERYWKTWEKQNPFPN